MDSQPSPPTVTAMNRNLAKCTGRVVAIGLLVIASGCGGTAKQAATTSTTVAASQTTAPADAQSEDIATGECDRATERQTHQYRTISGVDANSLSLDVYNPSGMCDAGVLVWVHGGGYAVGDKGNQMTNKIALAKANGWVLVSVNYRLSDPTSKTPAVFPNHYEDVAAAVAWVVKNIEQYGGDPATVALFGHSAGADIVSNVAVMPQYLDGAGLSLESLSCAGAFDTAGFDKAAASDTETKQWENALGNNPKFQEETSATKHVKAGIGIPSFIGVYRGSANRQAIEKGFFAALDAAGISTELIDARGLTHAEVNEYIGKPGDDKITPKVVSFLSTCFS